MRVATRRLRAALGTFEAVLPSSLATLREELRWVAAALGTVRDLDVQIEALETMQRGATWDESNALGPLLAIARERRHAARALLLEVLDSDRYARLVADTVAALRDTPPAEGAAPVRSFAAPVLRKRYRQFRREADALSPSSPAPEFHAVRVRAKRLRYTVEVFSVLAGRPAVQLVDSLKGAQDLLGEHQDADVAIEWLRDIVREHGSSLPPATLLLMGELMERHRGRMVEHRRRWPRAYERLADRWKPLRVAVERAQPSRTSKREEVPTTALIPTVVETEVTIVRRAPSTGRPGSRFHWFRRGGR
jgi:CHAD domain-containing protein